MTRRLVVVGDALLDRDVVGQVERVAPDAPVPVLHEQRVVARPGGAALAAALAARAGSEVTLVTALADDAAGAELRSLLARCGVAVQRVPASGPTAEKIRLRAGGQILLRHDRGTGPTPSGELPSAVAALLASAGAVLVADYGRGVAGGPAMPGLLARATAPLVWDPHPRGAPVLPGAQLVTPTRAELPGRGAPGLHGLTGQVADALAHWQAHGVAVTLGAEGALYLAGEGPPLVVRADAVAATDTCGAGDCFAATAAATLAGGGLPSEAVVAAVGAASRFVARGAAGGFWDEDAAPAPGTGPVGPVADLVRRVRESGGTVVATGGCFDLLHAGHVAHLAAARRLGDCLIVCLNSDRSVRALKGPDRPLVAEEDRRRVLEALHCVDAVVVFDEPTPARVLADIRPDVFAKGGDYGATRLAEQEVLQTWGGQSVVLPYHDGYSTSRLLSEARRR